MQCCRMGKRSIYIYTMLRQKLDKIGSITRKDNLQVDQTNGRDPQRLRCTWLKRNKLLPLLLLLWFEGGTRVHVNYRRIFWDLGPLTINDTTKREHGTDTVGVVVGTPALEAAVEELRRTFMTSLFLCPQHRKGWLVGSNYRCRCSPRETGRPISEMAYDDMTVKRNRPHPISKQRSSVEVDVYTNRTGQPKIFRSSRVLLIQRVVFKTQNIQHLTLLHYCL